MILGLLLLRFPWALCCFLPVSVPKYYVCAAVLYLYYFLFIQIFIQYGCSNYYMKIVQRIVSRRYFLGKIIYLVKFTGQNDFSNKWVTRKQLIQSGYQQMASQFQKLQKQFKDKKKETQELFRKHKVKKNSRKKQNFNIGIDHKQNISIIVNVETPKNIQPHWAYGNKVQKIIKCFIKKKIQSQSNDIIKCGDQNQSIRSQAKQIMYFDVKWDTGKVTRVCEQILYERQPVKLVQFFESQYKFGNSIQKKGISIKRENLIT